MLHLFNWLFLVVMSFVSILALHGALKCSKGIISLSERNIFLTENTIFISLKHYLNVNILVHLVITNTSMIFLYIVCR